MEVAISAWRRWGSARTMEEAGLEVRKEEEWEKGEFGSRKQGALGRETERVYGVLSGKRKWEEFRLGILESGDAATAVGKSGMGELGGEENEREREVRVREPWPSAVLCGKKTGEGVSSRAYRMLGRRIVWDWEVPSGCRLELGCCGFGVLESSDYEFYDREKSESGPREIGEATTCRRERKRERKKRTERKSPVDGWRCNQRDRQGRALVLGSGSGSREKKIGGLGSGSMP